jgi:putative ABC transport system permease protein
MGFNLFSDFFTIPFLICFAVIVGLISGSYPAFYLSSYEPVQVIKSYTLRGIRKTFLRNGLVIFQFAISIILFIGTFIIYEQLKFIQNKNLGFNKEHVIIINKADNIGNRIEPFKQQLLQNIKVINVSNSTAVPGDQKGSAAFWIEGTSSKQAQGIRFMWSDYDFLKTYHLRIAEGRYLSKDHPSDTNSVVLNQAAVRAFGVNDILGKYLVSPGGSLSSAKKYKIIGVINDFNFLSLHEVVQPLIIGLLSSNSTGNFLSVRIAPDNYAGTISFLENTWNKYTNGETINYNFLDRNLADLYIAEQRTSKLAAAFSVLAIFIACLGLLGLAAFITERRTKEIGIRKVVGATVPEIIIMLSKEFTKWVLVANILAWPIAYYFMSRWLEDFAYRININLWIFILSGILALIIALLTVSLHAIKAATANPVESLRYE